MDGAESKEAAAEAEHTFHVFLFLFFIFSFMCIFLSASSKLTAVEELIQEHSEYFHLASFFFAAFKACCAVRHTFLAAGRTLRVCHMQQGICFHSKKLEMTGLTDIFAADFAGLIYRSVAWIKHLLSERCRGAQIYGFVQRKLADLCK